jgi:heme exporter protein D
MRGKRKKWKTRKSDNCMVAYSYSASPIVILITSSYTKANNLAECNRAQQKETEQQNAEQDNRQQSNTTESSTESILK